MTSVDDVVAATHRSDWGRIVAGLIRLTGDWTVAEDAENTSRREASGLVAALLQWHLERGLRSLVMVDRGSDQLGSDQHGSDQHGTDQRGNDQSSAAGAVST